MSERNDRTDKLVRLRIVILLLCFLTAGLIIASIVVATLTQPYVAKHFCRDGTVTSKFVKGAKGGTDIYYCRNEATGEEILISPDPIFWSQIQVLVFSIAMIGFALLIAKVLIKSWGPKKGVK